MKSNIDEVIGMAWSDKVSFEEIKKKIVKHLLLQSLLENIFIIIICFFG